MKATRIVVLVCAYVLMLVAVVAAFVLFGKKKRSLLICAVPALFTLAGCMLSAVNGYFRYAMPLYVCAPMLIWLVAQSLQREK